MSDLDSKVWGVEASDKSNGDQDVAMEPTVKDDGRPQGSSTYDGPKLPYEQEANGNVSNSQLANVGRK
jgi:hypothetical protein